VDHVVAAGVAESPRVHYAAAGCARTVAVRNAINSWKGRHADGKSVQCRTPDANAVRNGTAHRDTDSADTNPNTDSTSDLNANANANADSNANANADPNANAGSGAPDVQPRVRHRDGERGVDQPDWQ
jgi:hypothetical protein